MVTYGVFVMCFIGAGITALVLTIAVLSYMDRFIDQMRDED